MTKLSWRHQTIIQALLSRGPLKETEFHSMFSGLTGKNPGTNQQLFKEYLLNINKALSFAHLELRGSINQYDGNVYYGVVNTVSDEQSKMGTKYTVPQIAFYKAIIEAIVQDPAASGVVSHFHALNLKLDSQVTIARDPQSEETEHQVTSALRYFTMTMKEKTLDELVRDQWLNSTADGDVTLGVKTFLDLRSWFRNNDVPSCHVCNEAGVKADLCPNEACTVRIHQYCLKQLILQRMGAKSCPSCGTQWSYTIPKAETVQIEDENETTGSQQATGSRRQRQNRTATGDADVVGAYNKDKLNELAASQRVTRAAGKRLRINRTGNADVVSSNNEVELSEPIGGHQATRSAGKRHRVSGTDDADEVATGDDELNESTGGQLITGSRRKMQNRTATGDADVVGAYNKDKLNELAASQRITRAAGKRLKINRTGNADVVGSNNEVELSEPIGGHQATRSAGKRHRVNGTDDADEVATGDEDELNESTGSQLITRPATKRHRIHTTGDADVVGTSAAGSNLRRVTRSSARQM